MKIQLIVIGAGDCADLIADSIDPAIIEIAGFVDEYQTGAKLRKMILSRRIQSIQDYRRYAYIISIAEPKVREKWYRTITELGLDTINVIDPTAIISRTARIGTGNYIGKGSVINANASIGDNNMIISTAVIEHHSEIGNHTRIAPSAVINGNTVIEDGAYIGSRACCIGDQRIGAFSTVGAGAVVLSDVPPGATVVGIPARRIK